MSPTLTRFYCRRYTVRAEGEIYGEDVVGSRVFHSNGHCCSFQPAIYVDRGLSTDLDQNKKYCTIRTNKYLRTILG